MILARYFLTLVGVIALQSTGAECIGRIKRQAGELGLDIISCDLADTDENRAARCVLQSPLRRFRTQSDADLIAKYFMGGLGGSGGLLGSSKSDTGESTSETKDSVSSSAAENVGDVAQSTGNTLGSDAAVVGAPNPLLGAAAAWLHPNTLLGLRNGLQGSGTNNFVGKPNPSSVSSSTSETNFVGSSHQDIGNSPPMGANSYFVGAPYPVQLQDGSSGLQMQPYWYSYNSMVGAQNPLLWNYPTPLYGMNSLQSADPAAGEENSLDESAKAAEELIDEPNSDSSLGAKKDTDLEEKTDESESASDDIEEPVVGNKQSDQSFEKDVTDPGEVKVQARDTSNYSTKQKQNRYRLKAGGAKFGSQV